MAEHTEWAHARRADVSPVEEGFSDAYGQGVDPGNIAVAIDATVIEGSPADLLRFAERVLDAVDTAISAELGTTADAYRDLLKKGN